MSQMLHLDKLGGSIVRNDSGEIIPPNAVVRIFDAAVVDGEPVLLGDKPDGSGGRHVINGPSQIAIDGFGECYEGYGKYALYDTGGDAPVNSDTFGPAADEWHLVKGNAGFTIVGGIQSGSVRVAVESGGSTERNFRLEERKDKTATSVNAKLLDDTLSPVGDTITVYDRHAKFSGPDQAKGVVERIDGKWQISQLNTWANTIYGTAVGAVAVGAVGDGNVANFGGHEWHTADPGSSVKIRVPPSGAALADTDPYAAELWDETTNPPTYLVTGPTTSTPGTAAADSIKTVNVRIETRKKTTDNSVSVLFLDDTNATVGVAVTVHDPHNEFAGLQYALGRATRVKDGTSDVAGRWEFTHLEAPAEYICGTLQQDMGYVSSGVTTAIVDLYWGPDWNRNNPGTPVEVETCGSLHNHLKSGAKVIAQLKDIDATTLRYVVVEALDNRAKVSLNDTTPGYLLPKVYNNNGSPPTYNGSLHQEVFADEQADGGDERIRYFTAIGGGSAARPILGVAASALTAASGNLGGNVTLGSGTVTEYSDAGVVGATSTWKNWMHSVVAAGKPVIGFQLANGDKVCIAEGCKALEASS